MSFVPVIIAPTFNNARTLRRVLAGMRGLKIPVIVVNDGSSDDTAAILAAWRQEDASHWVVSHSTNHGKAAALQSGFDLAAELRFTHAVTIDTDGQLDPLQIPALLHAARRSPAALILGRRDVEAADYPTASRVGRWASNLLIRWEAGVMLSDSQCGFRVYPLRLIRALHCTANRYGFESEILTRSLWAGLDVDEHPVDCVYDMPEGRVSHFRCWRDTFDSAGLHLRLLIRSMTPMRSRRRACGMIWQRLAAWFDPRPAWSSVRQDPLERSRFAMELALGVFIANIPLYGMQTLLCLGAARMLRLNPLTVVIGSQISTPPVGALLLALALVVGNWLLHGAAPIIALHGTYSSMIRSLSTELAVGSVVCGAALGAAVFMATRVLLWSLPLSTATAGAACPMAPAHVPELGAEGSAA